MAKRKIYIVAPGGARARGGMGRMVAHLAGRLAAGGDLPFEVIDTYGRRVNEAHALLAMPFHFLHAAARLFAACAVRRVALVHIQMAAYGSVYRKSLMLLICRLFRVPVIVHIHGGDLDRFCAGLGPRRRRALQWIFAGVARVIVLGEYWRGVAVSTLLVPEERVTIVYNAVPRPAVARAPADRDACEMLYLGMVWRQKGMDELLEALALPALAGRAWHMSIAGIGDLAQYGERARRLGLDRRVDFLGWADEAAAQRLLARADILVLPSHFECFPLAVVEAMAHGLAIVVTPVGAVPEAVVNGETGLLVPVGDSFRLAEAIARLIDDPGLRRRLGENARARFCDRFDLDIFERRMREIYRKHMMAA